MKKILNTLFIGFFNGIVIILPIVITVWIIRFLVLTVNNIVLEPVLKLLAGGGRAEIQHVYFVKGVILLMVIFGVAFIGRAARILVVHRFFSWWERVFIKLPIMGRIYNAIKQISSAFLGEGKTIFKRVVLVEYPRKGIYSIGFTTGDARGEIRTAVEKSCVNVFVPTTPNPTSGLFLVVPGEDVRFLDMSVEDGMKLVVSGGSVTPSHSE